MNTAHPAVSVSTLYFFQVLKILEGMGLCRDFTLQKLDLDVATRPDPKTRYSLERFDNLLTIASRELSNPHIAVSVGESFRIATYTNLGNILAFCKDIEEAAFINKRYSSLAHTLGVPHLRKVDLGKGLKDIFLWEPNFPKSDYQKFHKATENVISNYLTSLNWLAWGFGEGVVEVHFAHSPAEPVKFYDELLGCKTKFGMDSYRLIMADGVINRPLPTANAHQMNILKAKQETILNAYNNTNNLINRIEDEILNVIREQKPTLKIIAKNLGFTDRTLKRHIKEQSTTYSAIVQRVKRKMCDELLDEGFALAEIAHSLWYSDQAAFTHAYKKWHGEPPSRRFKK